MVGFVAILVLCGAVFATADSKKFRWCAIGKDEMAKCAKFKAALPGIAKIAMVGITPECVLGTDDEDCMKKIKGDVADFVTLDSGKVYQAGKTYELVPIVAEDYGSSKTGYYAVAVAKKGTDITIKTLKGKNSCHTGFRKTAGWNIPVGYLLENKMDPVGCGKNANAQSASKFFNNSCVPGAPKEKGLENLCALCPSGSNCEATSKNTYSGYHGAFFCMGDEKGDVAFVKHLTTGEVVKENPGKYGNVSDYKYLCTDGTTKIVSASAHESCNLAFNPSHAVMTRSGGNGDFVKVLLKASELCQPNTTAGNCSGFLIFDSKKYAPGKKDLLFKDSTKMLVDVGDRNTYRKWLKEGYAKALDTLAKDTECPSDAGIAKPLSVLLTVAVAVLGKAFL